MLEARGLTSGYRAGNVVRGVSLEVRAGEIVALIGANGAGKSTLLKTVSGLLEASAGELLLAGERIERLSTAERMRRGLAHVPEGRQVFAGLSVEENLRLGGYAQRHLGEAETQRRLAEVLALFPMLPERLRAPAGNLSGGQQQVLAIARGLMARPRMLLLDEPSLGLAPLLVKEIFALVAGLRSQGLAILLAEQNARQTLAIADRAYVLESGCVVLQGTGLALLHDPQVAQRYLGTGKPVSAATHRGGDALAVRLSALLRT
jgi:branched-chain amino acid transport system ATP-binding protein